jgi:hypothetical protein
MLKFGFTVLLLFAIHAISGIAKADPKLIHFGWDYPTIESLPKILEKFEASPFDSLSAISKAHDQIFTTKTLPETIDDADYSVFAKLKPRQLSNSYLVVHAAMDGIFDWSNDQHWRLVLNNTRSLAKLAHRGGFKGLVFEIEPYGKSPWDYSSQPARDKIDFAVFQNLVQKRGQDMIQAIQTEFPGLDLFCLYGLSVMASLLENPSAQFSEQGYGLWPAFFGGLMKAAAPTTRIIDGNKPS